MINGINNIIFSFFTVGFFFFNVVVSQEKNVFDIARTGSLDELKELVIGNPDIINSANKNGYYPLTIACYHGNKNVAKYLANNVKNIDVNAIYGTPLMAAVFKGHVDLVRLLLELGADPNIQDANGTTNLHYAVILRKKKIIELLLKHNADLNILDNKNRTALEYAKIAGNEEIIKLLEN